MLAFVSTIKNSTLISKIFIFLGAFVTALIGDITPTIVAIFILYLTDFCTGLIASIACRRVSSHPCLRGIIKTLLYASVLIISYQITRVTYPELLRQVALLASGTMHFILIISESISILENIDRLSTRFGIELPILNILKSFLVQKREAYRYIDYPKKEKRKDE